MTFSPRRELGRTGFRATLLGAGDLADRTLGLETCAATLRRALDAGLNVVDTAPAYEDGFSEEIVGRALAGRREGVFVVDKIDHLDRPIAPQIEASIGRLGFAPDAFVFHGVSRAADWAALVEPGGPFDQLTLEARAGRLRFRGVSTHHPDVARAAIVSGRYDLVLFPIGPYVDARYVDLLQLAREHEVGTICFKTFGAGMLVADTSGYGRPLPEATEPSRGGRLTVDECLSVTLTLDPDVALLGLSTPAEQDAAFAAARRFAPLEPARLADIRARAARAIVGKGALWWNPAADSRGAGP